MVHILFGFQCNDTSGMVAHRIQEPGSPLTQRKFLLILDVVSLSNSVFIHHQQTPRNNIQSNTKSFKIQFIFQHSVTEIPVFEVDEKLVYTLVTWGLCYRLNMVDIMQILPILGKWYRLQSIKNAHMFTMIFAYLRQDVVDEWSYTSVDQENCF